MKSSGLSDKEYYDCLCKKHLNNVFRYCTKVVSMHSIDIAEECTQNTFIEAGKQISKLRSHPNIEGWLYRTARNQINNFFRKQYKKWNSEIVIDDLLACTLIDPHVYFKVIEEKQLDIDELSEKALVGLNENEIELYKLYYKDRLSVTELAKKYMITSTAVTTRIYRLKKKIKIIVRKLIDEL